MLNTLAHRELRSQSGEAYSKSTDLNSLLGIPEGQSITIRHEILGSGRFSSRPHAHSKSTESIIVLDGEVVVFLGEEKISLKSGQFFRFDPSVSVFHTLKNENDREASYLSVVVSRDGDEVIYA